jgi:hypothetical protein
MPILSLVLFFLLTEPQSPLTVPSGTRIEATLESPVKTGQSAAGDSVSAVVIVPIRENNAVVIPRGSRLIGRVETIQAATHDNQGRVRLAFREIELPDNRRISTWITDAFEAPGPKRFRRYALWMGSLGVAGGLVGGKTARVAGVLGGLIAGFVIAEAGDNDNLPNLTLQSGQTLHLRFGEDLNLSPAGR